MIISEDIRPERQIYHLGALLLKVLKDHPSSEVDSYDVFELLNSQQVVSMNAYVLVLDWLFLLGAITNNNKRIVKCF